MFSTSQPLGRQIIPFLVILHFLNTSCHPANSRVQLIQFHVIFFFLCVYLDRVKFAGSAAPWPAWEEVEAEGLTC